MVLLNPGLLPVSSPRFYDVRAERDSIKDLLLGGPTRNIGDSLDNYAEESGLAWH